METLAFQHHTCFMGAAQRVLVTNLFNRCLVQKRLKYFDRTYYIEYQLSYFGPGIEEPHLSKCPILARNDRGNSITRKINLQTNIVAKRSAASRANRRVRTEQYSDYQPTHLSPYFWGFSQLTGHYRGDWGWGS